MTANAAPVIAEINRLNGIMAAQGHQFENITSIVDRYNTTFVRGQGLVTEYAGQTVKGFNAAGDAVELYTRTVVNAADAVDRLNVKSRVAPPTFGQGVQTQLGGIRNNFNNQGVTNIQSATLALDKLHQASGITDQRMQQLFDSIRNGSVRSLGQLTTSEMQAEVALRKLITAFNTAESAGRRTSEIMINFRTALRLIAIQQAHLAISKMSNAILGSIDAGKEYEIRLAEIQTITQAANRSTKEWSGSLVGLSNDFGVDILKTTEAAYEAASNQIAKGANVTVFLADAFTLARTTASTAEEAVNILSSAINAYGTSAVNAERYSAILFKVADLGRVRVGQLANTFGNTATLAHNMGISIEELGAAIATLTIQGIRPDTSMTLLNNIMLKLIKPTEEMKELFREWGVSTGEAAIATFGFQGVLARLDAEFQSGGVARLAEIGNDMRAIRGQVGLTGQAFAKFTEAATAMDNALKDYNAAAKLTAETMANQLNKEFAALHNLFVADAVQKYNRIVVEFAGNIGGLAKSMKSVVDGSVNTIELLAQLSAGIINAAKFTEKWTGGLESLIPAVLAVAAAYKVTNVAVATGIAMQTRHTAVMTAAGAGASRLAAWHAYLTGTTNATTASMWGLVTAESALTFMVPLLVGGITYAAASMLQSANDLADTTALTEASLNRLSQGNLKKLNQVLDEENQKFEKAVTERQQIFNRYIAAIRSVANEDLAEKLSHITGEIGKFEQYAASRNFELSLVSAEELDKFDLAASRIGVIQDEIHTLVQAGDMEAAAEKFKEMGETAKSFTDEAIKGVTKLDKEIKKLKKDAENKELEHELVGLSDPKKTAKLQELVTKLRKESQEEFKKSNLEEAQNKIKEAKKLDEQLINLSDKNKKKGKGGQRGIEESKEIAAEELAIVEAMRKKMGEAAELFQHKENEAFKQTVDGVTGVIDKMNGLKKATHDANKAVTDLKQSLADIAKSVGSKTGDADAARDHLAATAKGYGEHVATLPHTADNGKSGGTPESQQFRKMMGLKANLDASIKAYEDAKAADSTNIVELSKKSEQIKKDFAALNSATSNYTYGGIRQIFEKDKSGKSLFDKGRDTQAAGVVETKESTQLDLLLKARQTQMAQLAVVEQGMDAAKKAMKELAETSPAIVKKFNEDFKQDTKDFTDIVKELNRSMAAAVEALKQTGAVGKSNGGGLGFAGGGLMGGLGRDNQYYRGHSGEYVMNRETTSKFHSQLVAMNSGGSGARGLTSSGPTINVGDVNVSLHGNNNQQNAIEVARAIRRNVRAGTSKLS